METWDYFVEYEADISLVEFHANYLLPNVGIPGGSCDLIFNTAVGIQIPLGARGVWHLRNSKTA